MLRKGLLFESNSLPYTVLSLVCGTSACALLLQTAVIICALNVKLYKKWDSHKMLTKLRNDNSFRCEGRREHFLFAAQSPFPKFPVYRVNTNPLVSERPLSLGVMRNLLGMWPHRSRERFCSIKHFASVETDTGILELTDGIPREFPRRCRPTEETLM